MNRRKTGSISIKSASLDEVTHHAKKQVNGKEGDDPGRSRYKNFLYIPSFFQYILSVFVEF